MLDLNALLQLLAAIKESDIGEMIITHERVEIRSNAALTQRGTSAMAAVAPGTGVDLAALAAGMAAVPVAAAAAPAAAAPVADPAAGPAATPAENAPAAPSAGGGAAAGAAGGAAREIIAIRAPLPGVVHCHPARGPKGPLPGVGDRVAARAVVLVLEALKMNNEVLTPRAGIVRELKVQHGQKVKVGQVLMEIEVD